MKGPTQRSLDHLRKAGYVVDVVERWIPHARKRKDLFGFIDIMALNGSETLAVQTTSASNVAARIRKIKEHENLDAVRNAGWRILVHGWRKNTKGRWVLVERDIS